ncbi:MAG: histidine kinase [Alphaproteobacteria bacterium]|uniref:histidine kinase n=1 Tax=Candidatus Nitrobium versatile TaxID=2884831 RepID=A0A953J478_9BACT|nr:histidine kinase [Candidatus Nitrobium versatile]
MPGKKDTYPKKAPLSLLIILVAATAVTVSGTLLQYRQIIGATEDSLKFQALGIAVSLEASLKGRDLPPDATAGNVFRDIITEGRWEGIAFLALYDRRGTTLLHSNENLIGRRVEDPSIGSVAADGMPVYDSMTLGTGERVFILNFPVHIRKDERVLRLALHTYPAERVVRRAQLQMASIFAVLVILWIMSYFLLRAVKRSEELKRTMAERERLALLGEMSSVLAHEIRNPLGSIKGFAQFLLERGSAQREQESEMTGEYLGVIVAESERLETLTEDLLLYAKPVEVRPQTLSLRELAEESIAFLHPSPASGNGVTVQHFIPPDLVITSDRDKLKQILLNVIQNAMDAVGEDGRVEVRAGISDAPGGVGTVITVEDNGCGMAPALQARALSPFFTTKTRGTGLGLAIVEKLVQALGGSVEIRSEARKGTTVRIVLPGGQKEG